MTPIFLDRHKSRDRLRYAACALSDIGWREHPDYRAEQAMLRVLRHPFLAVQHAERAFIAYAVYLRYGGAPEAPAVKPLISMMSKRAVRRAEVVGRALRLAYRISGGAIDGLADTRLQVDDGKVDLFIPAESSHPDRPAIQRQLKALAAAAGLSAGQVRP
jgi:exopolyphosphatase/guanosine-5'-triphosphate,3'-diphosphate pyrophosphatase